MFTKKVVITLYNIVIIVVSLHLVDLHHLIRFYSLFCISMRTIANSIIIRGKPVPIVYNLNPHRSKRKMCTKASIDVRGKSQK